MLEYIYLVNIIHNSWIQLNSMIIKLVPNYPCLPSLSNNNKSSETNLHWTFCCSVICTCYCSTLLHLLNEIQFIYPVPDSTTSTKQLFAGIWQVGVISHESYTENNNILSRNAEPTLWPVFQALNTITKHIIPCYYWQHVTPCYYWQHVTPCYYQQHVTPCYYC